MRLALEQNLIKLLLSLLCAIVVAGCGEGSPFDPQDNEPVEMSGALLSRQFPTADGSKWEYISADGEHSYTLTINGTRNVGGAAVRIQESDSEIIVSQQGMFYGLPIRNSYFTKDLDSYTERAFDLWLLFMDDTYFQRSSPGRVLWSFPLYVDKEWTVSESAVAGLKHTRKVVSDNGVMTVPAGAFTGVYCVEEYALFIGFAGDEATPPGKYWLAPDVGVIKYEYTDMVSDTVKVYELERFGSEDANQVSKTEN